MNGNVNISGLLQFPNNNVSIGNGPRTQGLGAVAVGQNAGQTTQGVSAVAIGSNAGQTTQGAAAVAVGSNAGQINQGTNSVAIGPNAGQTNQQVNTIIINATNNVLNGQSNVTNATYIKPIRNIVDPSAHTLYYNSTTGEILNNSFAAPVTIGSLPTATSYSPGGIIINGGSLYYSDGTSWYKLTGGPS